MSPGGSVRRAVPRRLRGRRGERGRRGALRQQLRRETLALRNPLDLERRRLGQRFQSIKSSLNPPCVRTVDRRWRWRGDTSSPLPQRAQRQSSGRQRGDRHHREGSVQIDAHVRYRFRSRVKGMSESPKIQYFLRCALSQVSRPRRPANVRLCHGRSIECGWAAIRHQASLARRARFTFDGCDASADAPRRRSPRSTAATRDRAR